MTRQAPSVCLVTLGCPKNEVDSNRMLAKLEHAGFVLVDDTARADVAIVNTCSFITAASEESIDMIFEVLDDGDFKARGGKLVVSGCLPSRYGDELAESLPEAAAFLPVDDEDRVVELVSSLTGYEVVADDAAPVRELDAVSAYVKISDGCDRFCSFCAIPYIRGGYHSRTFDEIEGEVALLEEQGAREVVLIGQDTSVWGCDLCGEDTLASLMDRLASAHPGLWIRVMYLQPEGVTDDLLDVFAAHDNICDYFDIPLQHADKQVLEDMNRTGDLAFFLEVLDKIRTRLPDAALRTTLIAGFPGETDGQFEELLELVRLAGFEYLGVFAYSPEDGTKAALREDQVDEDTRLERVQQVRDLADDISFKLLAEHVDEVHEVLVEGYEEADDGLELVGRMRSQAPEVDGLVHIPLGSAEVGSIVRVRLEESFCYEYSGSVVGDD